MSTNKPAPIADYCTLAAFNVAFDMVKRANRPGAVGPIERSEAIAEIESGAKSLGSMVDEEHGRRRDLRVAAVDDLYDACRAVLRDGHQLGEALNKVIAALEKADGVG